MPSPGTTPLPQCPWDNKSCSSSHPSIQKVSGSLDLVLPLCCVVTKRKETLPGGLPQSWDTHTSFQHQHRVAQVKSLQNIRAEPRSSPQEVSWNFRELILVVVGVGGCHRRSLGISDLDRNIPGFPCSASSPGGKVPGSRGEDGIAAAFHFVSSASLAPHAASCGI